MNAVRFSLALALALVSASLGAVSAQDPAPPDWTLEGNAPWQARDSQAEYVYRDRLWIMGGWFQSYEAPPRDVWSSPDGREWKRVTPKAPWIHSDLPMNLTFDGRMWIMGGWFNGRLPGHSASNQVWASTDGAEWEQVTDAAGWSPRLAGWAVEFQGRMWMLGGTENYYFGDAESLKNDVWSSADGREWRLETAEAGWSPRAYHQAVVLNDKIYVFGGGNYAPDYHATNDVWSSHDGIEWTRETEAAPWAPRLWFSAAVYRDRMWMIGGWAKEDGNFADVWHSGDGRKWERLETKTRWKARHEHSVFVFQDKLWVAGGHAKPLSNEVWSLHLPKDFAERTP
ncbi:MAG: kelch repeat-containing protein [Verrucomicrobiales bacterium]